MGIWFLFLDFYGYRENGLGHETTARQRQHITKEKDCTEFSSIQVHNCIPHKKDGIYPQDLRSKITKTKTRFFTRERQNDPQSADNILCGVGGLV